MKNKTRNVLLIMLIAGAITNCALPAKVSAPTDQHIKAQANKDLVLPFNDQGNKVFVSHIYNDKELGEVFLQVPDGNLIQISNRKQHISSLLFDNNRNSVIYGQSQEDSKLPKILEPPIINAPSRFSKYQIKFYGLNDNSTKVLLDLSQAGVVGSVANMAFLDDGSTLTFQTAYGNIYFVDLNNALHAEHTIKASKFKPEVQAEQFLYDDFYNLKTDGKHSLIFDAISGYKSQINQTFVYNTFKYDIQTHQLDRLTNNSYTLNIDSK